MKTEHMVKARAAHDKIKREYGRQTIPITGKLTIRRLDYYNWGIIRKGEENNPWFYGSLLHALQALPEKMLLEGDKATLGEITKQMGDIRLCIERLYAFKGWEKLEENRSEKISQDVD